MYSKHGSQRSCKKNGHQYFLEVVKGRLPQIIPKNVEKNI